MKQKRAAAIWVALTSWQSGRRASGDSRNAWTLKDNSTYCRARKPLPSPHQVGDYEPDQSPLRGWAVPGRTGTEAALCSTSPALRARSLERKPSGARLLVHASASLGFLTIKVERASAGMQIGFLLEASGFTEASAPQSLEGTSGQNFAEGVWKNPNCWLKILWTQFLC